MAQAYEASCAARVGAVVLPVRRTLQANLWGHALDHHIEEEHRMFVDVTHQPEYTRGSFPPMCGSPDCWRWASL